jgi:hypothetical protein
MSPRTIVCDMCYITSDEIDGCSKRSDKSIRYMISRTQNKQKVEAHKKDASELDMRLYLQVDTLIQTLIHSYMRYMRDHIYYYRRPAGRGRAKPAPPPGLKLTRGPNIEKADSGNSPRVFCSEPYWGVTEPPIAGEACAD